MTQSLSARLKQPGLISAPGVFEMISARIADTMGFDALYMTGYGVVASHLGLPDAGLASYTEMVGRVHQIASGTSTPLIADGDTGYGGLLNVDFTVRGYEKAGAQAIQIEDQEYPKKCGHTPGRRVVPIADAARRIKVAVEARASKDFLVIARTDARTALGLDEALRRGEAFLKAGADMLFIEAPETDQQQRDMCQRFKGRAPLLANMVEGGQSPVQGAAELGALGFRIVIFPGGTARFAASQLQRYFASLRMHGTTGPTRDSMLDFDALNAVIGTPELIALGQRYEG